MRSVSLRTSAVIWRKHSRLSLICSNVLLDSAMCALSSALLLCSTLEINSTEPVIRVVTANVTPIVICALKLNISIRTPATDEAKAITPRIVLLELLRSFISDGLVFVIHHK